MRLQESRAPPPLTQRKQGCGLFPGPGGCSRPCGPHRSWLLPFRSSLASGRPAEPHVKGALTGPFQGCVGWTSLPCTWEQRGLAGVHHPVGDH